MYLQMFMSLRLLLYYAIFNIKKILMRIVSKQLPQKRHKNRDDLKKQHATYFIFARLLISASTSDADVSSKRYSCRSPFLFTITILLGMKFGCRFGRYPISPSKRRKLYPVASQIFFSVSNWILRERVGSPFLSNS